MYLTFLLILATNSSCSAATSGNLFRCSSCNSLRIESSKFSILLIGKSTCIFFWIFQRICFLVVRMLTVSLTDFGLTTITRGRYTSLMQRFRFQLFPARAIFADFFPVNFLQISYVKPSKVPPQYKVKIY